MKARHRFAALASLLVLPLLACRVCSAFVPNNNNGGGRIPWTTITTQSQSTAVTTTTQLSMVMDFFKKRTTEGLEQLSNLADSAYKGKLGEGLKDAAEYTSETNAAFASGLAKSRTQLLQNMELLLTGSSDDILSELQDVLLQADLGMKTSEDVVNEVKSLQASGERFMKREDLLSVMRGKLIENLDTGKSGAITFTNNELPTVLFVMGANGMGKTTTIGKLAHRLRTEGNQTVLVAACDTFRAGAVEQLEQWADRANVDCFSPSEGQNSPSAVLYGALDKALAEKYDTVLVDTSGRLSNNEALTAELAKMKRVIQKRLSLKKTDDGKPIENKDVPHETLLVLDAAQGRMALDSAKAWDKDIGLTGLILTKLDGSARGGSVVAVSRELGLPVKLIGVGEGINDLRDFEPARFVDGLLGIGAAGGSSSDAEGKILAERLADMRKTRDLRAIEAKKANKVATSKAPAMASMPNMGGGGASAAGEMTFQEMDEPEIVTATGGGGGGGGGRSRRANKSKKKKKRKKKR